MFGYVRPWTPELRVREYEYYRALYCGLCRAMKKETGFFSSFLLNYDTVFLLMTRCLYREKHIATVTRRCAAHPWKKHKEAAVTESLREGAAIFAILAAAKNRDDYGDEHGAKKLRAALLSPLMRHMEKKAGHTSLRKNIDGLLTELSAIERENVPSVDAPAEVSGKILGLCFAEGMPCDTPLYEIGFHLGRIVYKIDAYDDYADDVKKDRYNPYRALYGDHPMTAENRKAAADAIRLDLYDLEKALSGLPQDGDPELTALIKNILYLGLDVRLDRKGNA